MGSTTAPYATPDDLRPLKLFCWAGDNESVETWRAASAATDYPQ